MKGVTKEEVVARGLEEGFVKVGVCRPDAVPEAAGRLRAFLEAGRHGQMGWMEEREGWRGSAAALWPEARSVIMLAEAYTPESDPMAGLARRDRGVVSVYAQGKDYHDLVKRRLKRLGRWLIDRAGGEIKVFVDTAPVMEKPLAQAAGLGWQGKHTNLLGRDLGNWIFLGAIFTTLELEPDAPEVSHCGSCTACLDICPTRAFPAPYQLDARRCISYLTIEHRGPVDPELRGLMATGSMAVTIAWRSVPGTSSPWRRGILGISPASACRSWPNWLGWTMPGFGSASRDRPSSGSDATDLSVT